MSSEKHHYITLTPLQNEALDWYAEQKLAENRLINRVAQKMIGCGGRSTDRESKITQLT